MKLLNCCTFYFRILVRTWIIPILFLGIVVYGAYVFYLYKTLNDPTSVVSGNPLNLGLMICYLFIGIYITKIDTKEEIQETFGIIKNALLYKSLAKCLLILTSIAALIFVFFGIYMYLFFNEDFKNTTYFLSVFKYLWLYWGLSSFIMFLLGSLLATWIRGKMIYLVSLVLYIITLPINNVILNPNDKAPSGIQLDKLFNLGEPSIRRSFNSLYGFSLDPIHWDKKFFIISFLFLCFLLTWRKRKMISKLQFKLSFLSLLVIALGTLVYGLQPHQVLSDDDTKLNRYYYNTKISRNNSYHSSIHFQKYDIKLSAKSQLEALVEVDGVNTTTENLEQIKLGLFHELKLHQVKIDNNKVNFKQKGDTVTLYLGDENWKPNCKKTIEFKYSGLQSNLYFGNSQAIYLPNYMSWLPSESLLPSFIPVGKEKVIHRVPNQPTDEKEYTLKLKGIDKLYTNLKERNDGTWSGVSSDGVSLISGQLTSKTYNNIKYVFPNTWESEFKNTNHVFHYLTDVTTLMKDSLRDDSISFPSTIYFVPNQNISDGYTGEGTWWNKDYLIWGFNYVNYPIEPFFQTDYLGNFTQEIVLSKTKQVSASQEDYLFNALFANVYAQALNSKMDLPNEALQDDFTNMLQYRMKTTGIQAQVGRQVKVWLHNEEALDPNSHVYRKWFALIQHPTSQKWNALYNILEKENLK